MTRQHQLPLPERIEIIEMADVRQFGRRCYDVWCDFSDGSSEQLNRRASWFDEDDELRAQVYIAGLRAAVLAARQKWGAGARIELARWCPRRHRPPLVLSGTAA